MAKSTDKAATTKAASTSAASSSKTAAAKPAKKASTRKPNAAFMAPLNLSDEMAQVVGSKALPRTEVVKKIWEHIKKNDLQDSKNRRMINADDKLKTIFGGKAQISMFDLAKIVNNHVKK